VPAGRWPSGWSPTASWSWTSPRNWPPGCVYFQGHGRKTDRDDAVSIGLAALDGSGIAPGYG